MFRKRNNTRFIVTGALIGGATGSLLTFLLTPKTGKELRGDIKNGIDTSMSTIKDTSGKVMETVKNTTSDTLNRVQAAINAGVTTYRRDVQNVKTSNEIMEETLREGNSTHANI